MFPAQRFEFFVFFAHFAIVPLQTRRPKRKKSRDLLLGAAKQRAGGGA